MLRSSQEESDRLAVAATAAKVKAAESQAVGAEALMLHLNTMVRGHTCIRLTLLTLER